MNKKKVAIVFAAMGGGHKSVAESLYRNLKDMGANVELLNPENSLGKVIGIKDNNKSYRFVTKKMAWLDLFLYYITYISIGKYIYNQILYYSCKEAFEKQFKDDSYDLIVNLLPHYNYVLQRVKRDAQLRCKTICVITDIVKYIGLWEENGYDEYIVPTQEIYDTLNLDVSKVMTGLPIQDIYFENVHSTETPGNSLSLNVLITAGGDGMGAVEELINKLDKYCYKGQLTISVACGKNEELKERLEKYKTILNNIEIDILGHLPNLKSAYEKCDLILIKGGPTSIWELINMNKPFIIYDYILSQERANPEFAMKYGRAMLITDLEKLARKLAQMNKNNLETYFFPTKEVPEMFKIDWERKFQNTFTKNMSFSKFLSNNKHLGILLLVGFIDAVGASLEILILPSIMLDRVFVGYDKFWSYTLLGFLIAIYGIAQFLFAPFLGILSDKFGRKKLIIICLSGTLVSKILFVTGVLSLNPWIIFIGRFLDGATGGNVSVTNSALIDISKTDKEKTKNLGLLNAVQASALGLGPVLGALAASRDFFGITQFANPAIFGIFATGIAIILATLFFKESLKEPVHKLDLSWKVPFQALMRIHNFRDLWDKLMAKLFISIGFLFIANTVLVYIKETYKWSVNMQAYAIGALAIVLMISFTYLSHKFESTLVKTIQYTLFLSTVSLLFITLLPQVLSYSSNVFIAFIVFFGLIMAVSLGVMIPNLNNLLSKSTTEENQGEIMGFAQSAESIAFIITSIVGNTVMALFAEAPLALATICMGIAWYLSRKFK